MPLSSCPVCGGRSFMAAAPAAALRREVEERNQFVSARMRRRATRAELKDLTDFMHDGDACVSVCVHCRTLVRLEAQARAADSYAEDANDAGVMQHLYPRYVQAFRNKAVAFRDLLPVHASVVEIGPHLGGFLQVAEEWDWRAVGLDVGEDTSEFARKQGLSVRRETAEDSGLRSGSADGVFVWNCFEQLPEPDSALAASRRLLRPHGLLVLRVPNARAWLQNHDRDVLAWNNLLGWPYLYGYNADSLARVGRRWGFEPVSMFASELVTMPFPDPARDVIAEQCAVSARTRNMAEPPWLELVFRRVDEVKRSSPATSREFLARAG